MKVWTGTKWRRVSEVEARFRRARGEEVVASEAKPAPRAQVPVKSLAELPTAPRAPRAPIAPPGVPADFDLSDDELERLTAPGHGG